MRERQRAGRDACTLFNMPLLVEELEGLYAGMWRDFHAGNLPKPDLANLDAYLEVGCAETYESTEVQMMDDYHGRWRSRQGARHKFRPLPPDNRLMNEAKGS